MTVKLPQKGHPGKGQVGSPGFCASAKSDSKPAREAAPPPRARAAEETRGRRIPEPRHPDLTNPAPAIPRTHHRRPGSTPRTCARRPQAYTAEALPLPAPVTGVGAWPSAAPPRPTRERSPGQVFTLRIRALGTAQPGHAPSVSRLGSSSEGQAHSSLRGGSPAWPTSPPWESPPWDSWPATHPLLGHRRAMSVRRTVWPAANSHSRVFPTCSPPGPSVP